MPRYGMVIDLNRCLACQACVIACPAEARIFGDLNDPNSPPSQALVERKGQVLRPDFGAKPRVYYVK